MPRNAVLCLAALLCAADLTAEDRAGWLAWRGPNRNGVAEEGQNLPDRWSETENVLWQVKVPGRGHSSPVIAGDRILLTTADDQTQVQSVICFDRRTGQQNWQTPVNQGGFPPTIHHKNTHATPTLACNGRLVFAVFNNHDGVQLACLNLDGKILWQKITGSYVPKQYKFGYAASPLLFRSSVITIAEFEQSFMAAFDQTTGEELWRIKRPNQTSYSSPIIATVAGREQLLLSGDKRIVSYDPATGEQLWSAPGTADATCGTVIWNENAVFASGGYPNSETIGIKADGSGQVLWKNNTNCYEQSMLIHDGHVYAVDDNGIAFCWRASDGKEMWKKRLGGLISASPVLADGLIYAANERGEFFIFHANPEQYQETARFRFGDEVFATPSITGGCLYLRIARQDKELRQEYLYCIARK